VGLGRLLVCRSLLISGWPIGGVFGNDDDDDDFLVVTSFVNIVNIVTSFVIILNIVITMMTITPI